MSVSVWALFVLTESVSCLTRGPAVLLVIAHALTRGAAAAAWAALGILSANVLYFALSATGLGVVLIASYEAFSLLRWLGARRRTFVDGFVLQAANPKALLFFVALLLQFIDPAAPVPAQILVLGVTSVVIELVVLLGYGAAAGRFHALAEHPRFARPAGAVAGTMLVGAGLGAIGATHV